MQAVNVVGNKVDELIKLKVKNMLRHQMVWFIYFLFPESLEPPLLALRAWIKSQQAENTYETSHLTFQRLFCFIYLQIPDGKDKYLKDGNHLFLLYL